MFWIRKIHKWASLIVGIQLLIWLGSGFYFNIMDHQKTKGNQYRVSAKQHPIINQEQLIELKDILSKARPAVSMQVIYLLGNPIYLLTHDKGLYRHFKNSYSMIDAYSGRVIVLNSTMAEKLALSSYSGSGNITSTMLIHKNIEDFPKQKNATWQINFSDELNTSVYVEAETGRIVGHSNDDKRFADIFFMLHFMDYTGEGSFNSIQIMLFAFITLWLTLTGFIWTIQLGFSGQYQVTFFSRQRKIKLFDKNLQSIGALPFNTKNNLLDGLAQNNVYLPSNCGGGGTCGSCRVLLKPNGNISTAEEEKLSKGMLNKGYRLSCQQFPTGIESITLLN